MTFDPDQYLASKSVAAPEVNSGATGGFDPDAYLQKKEHEGAAQQIETAIEGAGRGASFGYSDVLAKAMRSGAEKLGVPEQYLDYVAPKVEEIKARQEANPGIALAGNIVGGGALGSAAAIGATAEAALAARGVAPVVARALGYGIEGGAFGAGQINSDLALGDPNINSQKIMQTVGVNTLFGSGLGLLNYGLVAKFPGLSKVLGENPIKSKTIPEGIGSLEEAASGIGASPASAERPGVEDVPHLGIKKSSIDEIEKRVADAKYSPDKYELPQKGILQDAASRVGLSNPIHPLQVDSLSDQATRDLYKTALEMPGKEGDALRNYEGLQKQEMVRKTDALIDEIHPDQKPISTAYEAGQKVIDNFTNQYKSEQEMLGPAFEELKKMGGKENHLAGAVGQMTESVPGLSNAVKIEKGSVKLKPYDTSWGVDKATYNAFKDAVGALKSEQDIKGLFNIRKGLDQNIDVMAQGTAPQEIRSLKKSMMDYIQGKIGSYAPESMASDVREVFKRYAINEQERQVIEKTFGASVGKPEFGMISKVKPEEVLDKIFRNTATIQAAKNILGPQKFNEALSNYMAIEKATATDKGVFSSNKFGTFLKKNIPEMQVAFSDQPDKLQRLKDLNTIMRILPDSASINPSGTAKTLWGILKAHSVPELLTNVKEYGKERLKLAQMRSGLESSLKGNGVKSSALNSIKSMTDKVDAKIQSGAKAIFSPAAVRSSAEAGAAVLSDKEYDKIHKRITELSGNPESAANHLAESTKDLYAVAPNVTQGLHNSFISALQFLNSKLPKTNASLPLSHDFKASPAQISKFGKYFEAVNDPLSVLRHIKSGSLSNEYLEAIQAVHPHLLDEMRSKILENMDLVKAKNLSYGAKISLAKLLGTPLEENMLPQVIISYQALLSGPSMSNQGIQKSTLGGQKELKLNERTQTNFRNESKES